MHELILEVGDDIVSKTMKEKQKSKLSEKVNEYIAKGKWVSCLDIVEEFIDTVGDKVTLIMNTSLSYSLLVYMVMFLLAKVKGHYIYPTSLSFRARQVVAHGPHLAANKNIWLTRPMTKMTTKRQKTTTKRRKDYKEMENYHRDSNRSQRCAKHPKQTQNNHRLKMNKIDLKQLQIDAKLKQN